MPSQTLTREDIRRRYGEITDFVAPYAGHPISDGLQAAQVTDDTEQALLLGRRLLQHSGKVDAQGWALDLLDWEAGMRARGLSDLLGPSSKAALNAIRRGADPNEAAKHGTTNGAAMRIAPVGLLASVDDLAVLVDAVEHACRVTHNTGEAIAGASAVAAYISHRIVGSEHRAAFAAALRAAELGERRGHKTGQSGMAQRMSHAVGLAASETDTERIATSIGTSVASHQSVPTAFALLHMGGGDVWRTGLLAANIGDDTDTIGAIACAMCGAGAGIARFPADKLAHLKSRNTLDIEPIAAGLVRLRGQMARSQPETTP